MSTQQQPSAMANRVHATIRAEFARQGEGTRIARLYETGGLRLRHPHAPRCEAVIVNTGGGLTGGDKAEIAIAVGCGADVIVTTQAAEKIYRAATGATEVDISLRIDAGGRLEWLPQETILFDRARLHRRLDVALPGDGALTLVEAVVFGRLARGETSISGALRDSWRIRRAGQLIFAEELRMDGALGAMLERPAIGRGARATALLLHVAPASAEKLDALRIALDPFADLDCGASAWNGMLVARFASPSPERLRAAILAALAVLRGQPAPRVWQ